MNIVFQLFVVFIMLFSNSALFADIRFNSLYSTPSAYVTDFLKQSTSLYTGSADWKLKLHKTEGSIETVFGQTHLKKYVGLAARAFHFARQLAPNFNSETAVSGRFSVVKHLNHVEITSTIIDTEVDTAQDEYEASELRGLAICYNGNVTSSKDACTHCTSVTQLYFDEYSRRLTKVVKSKCTSRVTYEELMVLFNDASGK